MKNSIIKGSMSALLIIASLAPNTKSSTWKMYRIFLSNREMCMYTLTHPHFIELLPLCKVVSETLCWVSTTFSRNILERPYDPSFLTY